METAPRAVARVVGEVHGDDWIYLDTDPHQRKGHGTVANVAVGHRGLDGQDRSHGGHSGIATLAGVTRFARVLRVVPCRPAPRTTRNRAPTSGPPVRLSA